MMRRWNSSVQQQTFLQCHAQVENQIPKLSKQTSIRQPPAIHLRDLVGQVKKRDAISTEWPLIHWLKQVVSFHIWTLNFIVWSDNGYPHCNSECMSNRTNNWSAQMQAKSMSKLQSCYFRCLQKTVWIDNNHRNNQEPATGQNLPTTLQSLRHMSHHWKDPFTDWTTATQQRSQITWTSQGQFQ